ncbi:MAG: flagellar basal body-associated FliL family protein [Planctomycetes bacterium]|nr:flagellar basal body-associated FliL family protein [Planctomycetota bacterium]
MADEKKPEAPAAPAAPSKMKAMLPILVAVLVCVAGAVTVGIMAFPDAHLPEPHGGVPAKKEPKETFQAPIPKILVNLAEDTRGNRILQAEITLEMSVVDPLAAQAEFNKLLPKVQDKLIATLSSYTATDLEGSQSKEMAKTRIKDEMNRDLFGEVEMKVAKVLFTEFVVQ